ncbi:MAG: ASKHA domain-containing protein, partial [Methanoregula sp.]|nr:ASKHA domain-containing protein [Methanoregula sp.]
MQEPTIRVIFQPMNRVLSVPAGTPLFTALREAGIWVESICGGKGFCGKCRVILTNGTCSSQPDSATACHLSPEEKASGYYLACQVTLTADAEFMIPVESRIDSPQILISSTIAIDAVAPSVSRYRVEVMPTEGLPFASHSIRFSGYSGPRPRMSDERYNALLTSGIPQSAILSTARSPPEVIAVGPAEPGVPLYGAAIDLGTTTVVGCLVNLETGAIAATASAMNCQITYGEELITRIGYAASEGGLETLQRAARESVNTVLLSLAESSGIDNDRIMDVCIAGNTVMNHLLCGMDPRHLDLANAPVSREPLLKRAGDLGLCTYPESWVYILPNVSRFVGGDAIGDLIASGMHVSGEPGLIIDLGTNGEIVLGNRTWSASVSCASGPAFEGAGVTSGMRAMKGAIDHVRVDPVTREISVTTIGDARARGICGSGIIDAAVAMLRTGALDFAGKIRHPHPRVRSGADGYEYVLVPTGDSATGRDIVITQRDIDYLMDSKAAACGAIAVLLKKYKCGVDNIRHVYLSGAFGAYTDIKNATRFGILPEFPHAEVHAIGNGSLSGAYATLVST